MAKKKEAAAVEPIVAYKGFNQDLSCRGFKFEDGKTYTHEGPVKACESGFHSCEYPIDVFRYYAPGVSVFRQVVASGDVSRHDEDSKIASSILTIKAAIDIPCLIKAAIEFVTKRCDPAKSEHATGYSSASSATGDSSASSATGYSSASLTTGSYSSSEVIKPESQSVAIGVGYANRAKAPTGCAIVLAHRDGTGKIIHIRASKVGENGIEPDVFYTLDEHGEFVRADQQEWSNE